MGSIAIERPSLRQWQPGRDPGGRLRVNAARNHFEARDFESSTASLSGEKSMARFRFSRNSERHHRTPRSGRHLCVRAGRSRWRTSRERRFRRADSGGYCRDGVGLRTHLHRARHACWRGTAFAYDRRFLHPGRQTQPESSHIEQDEKTVGRSQSQRPPLRKQYGGCVSGAQETRRSERRGRSESAKVVASSARPISSGIELIVFREVSTVGH